ncbi:hypothetical protein GCM10027403_14540 [Arthrobacter tecti]
MAALPNGSLQDPVAVGMMFVNALADHRHYEIALSRLVTPESLPYWGDFSEIAEHVASIENWGFGSIANEAVGDPNVRYCKLMSGVESSFQVTDAQIINAASIITMVWRPEYDQWMVHAMGSEYLRPEEVPH